jgi:2-phosphosulfolactate phosphatase
MKFHYTNLETCHEATGVVVVIDVIRAFTNAAVMFARGALEVYPVSGVEEALQLRAQIPNALASGEVGGIAPEGFDFGNSPTQTNALNLTGKTIVQRTGAGTQGVVRSVNAEIMLAASIVVAGATVRHIQQLNPATVTFVITGQTFSGGDEDLACAEYLEALLKGEQPDPEPFRQRVINSRDGLQHLDPLQTAFPFTDLDHCARIDAFDFSMLVTKENDRHVMRAIQS